MPFYEGRTLIHERKTYAGGTLYILDDVYELPKTPEADTSSMETNRKVTAPRRRRAEIVSVHAQKCQELRRAFEDITPYDVKSVPPQSTSDALIDWVRADIASKPEDHFILFYFGGGAGHNGEEYAWKLRKAPSRVDAFGLLKCLSASNRDILVILDCYIPTRFQNKSFLQRQDDATSNIEIVACGAPDQSEEGVAQANPFTLAITNNMQDIVSQATTGAFKKRVSFSILDMLSGDKKLDNNPYRICLSPAKVKRDKDGAAEAKRVYRFRINPNTMRRDKRITFERHLTLDTTENGKASKKRKVPHDEGYAEDEGSNTESVDRTRDGSLFVRARSIAST